MTVTSENFPAAFAAMDAAAKEFYSYPRRGVAVPVFALLGARTQLQRTRKCADDYLEH